jgi:periplasmic divalent cation tolerance protein
MSEPIIVQCTTSSAEEARRIARALLEAKLAACASIAAQVESHYWWQGAIEQSDECLMLIKTTRERFDAVRRAILEHHSYAVPEIVALPIVEGHDAYLKWLAESVGPEDADGGSGR